MQWRNKKVETRKEGEGKVFDRRNRRKRSKEHGKNEMEYIRIREL